ncbi:TIGR03826 family flagellar region protein [Alicyclobacillus macrosporangiidus]|jgi:flagellar operon protein (TIGR03826 family)|uniref:TIGR03826 family flagellar region protein n=1 Tax=Alicyclobacillus macrosporangiidus TaxID=392015 RepID=UPI0009F81331|nr:TIGR03826 family flagellar region protein [Alicyclobacillus macrosporangiidus]
MGVPIANCKRCGRLFNRVRRDICPACVAEEDKAFETVRQYLREHRDATMAEVSEETGVGVDLIIAMIQDGRLMLRDNPNLHYPCERCGQPTRAGRYCPRCTKELSASLSAAARDLRKKAQEMERGQGYYSR